MLQEANDSVKKTPESLTATVSSDPHAINGAFGVAVFPAKDARHAPTEDTVDGTRNGQIPFMYPNFAIYTTGYTYYWNVWDASNIGTPGSTDQALSDLANDVSSYRTADNRLVMGWAHDMDHNGRSQNTGTTIWCTSCKNTVNYGLFH